MIGQDVALFYRLLEPQRDPVRLRREEIDFWPKKYFYLDAQGMDEKSMLAFAERLKPLPAVRFYGYCGAIDEFAGFCLDRGIRIPGVLFAEVSATPVNAVIRGKIREAFGCAAFDLYSSNEMMMMATECSESGADHHLHVVSDLRDVEILGDGGMPVEGDGEGVVAATSFTNRVFPFVRYVMGDRARRVRKPCACGLPFPCISPVSGRATDYLVKRSGGRVFGITACFDDFPDAVRGFQFRQHRDGSVSFLVAPNGAYAGAEKEISAVFNRFRAKYAGEIDFRLERVDAIPHDAGKIRFIIHE